VALLARGVSLSSSRFKSRSSPLAMVGQRWALLLTCLTLLAGAMVALGVRWHVSRD